MAVYFHVIVGDFAKGAPENINDIEATLTPNSDTATAAFAATRWVLVFNGEAGTVKVAKGTTPDADAAASAAATSAFVCVPGGQYAAAPILVMKGEKLEWKAA